MIFIAKIIQISEYLTNCEQMLMYVHCRLLKNRLFHVEKIGRIHNNLLSIAKAIVEKVIGLYR